MKFKIIRPVKAEWAGRWIDLPGDDPVDVIQQWHYDHVGRCDVALTTEAEKQHFLVAEFEDGVQLISRVCTSGIWRKGGVYSRWTLDDVAKALDVSPADLQGPWEREKQYTEDEA